MPVYVEKVKCKKTGKLVEKKVNDKKQYFIRTYVTDEYGNKKQITKHNKNWLGREGQLEASQEENRLKNGEIKFQSQNLTLNELALKYFEYIDKRLKPSTIRKNKDNYNLHIKPYFKNKKVNEISNKDILNFHNYINSKKKIITTKKAKRKTDCYYLSIAFKQSIHTTLNSILNFGCKYYGLEKNVAQIVGNFQIPKGVQKDELNILTEEEFKKFITYESNETYKDFFEILFYTGLRRGELLALTPSDIDFVKHTISITKSVNPKNGINATVPKTNKSNREIPITSKIYNIFLKYKNEPEIFGLNKIKLTTLQRRCDNNCKKANIDKNIRIHDFRHSFASMCINLSVKIEILSAYMGHEHISTTMNIYGHLYPNSQHKLIDLLEKQDQKQDQKN